MSNALCVLWTTSSGERVCLWTLRLRVQALLTPSLFGFFGFFFFFFWFFFPLSLKMFLQVQKCYNHIIITAEFVFWLSFSDFSSTDFDFVSPLPPLTMSWMYIAIFLTNGLCIVYCSLPQWITLVYPGWGQKSEVFRLQVTTHRLQGGTAVDYRSTTAALL